MAVSESKFANGLFIKVDLEKTRLFSTIYGKSALDTLRLANSTGLKNALLSGSGRLKFTFLAKGRFLNA